MSTSNSETLNGYSDSWTEAMTLHSLATEETVKTLFSQIPEAHQLAMAVIVLVVGLVLNSIIFRCYFRVKSSIAPYIRVFAVFDCFVIMVAVSIWILSIYIAKQHPILYFLNLIISVSLNSSMLGPLFLALDRFLIVSFPHNFQLHEKKVRGFKIALLLLEVILSSHNFVEGAYQNVIVLAMPVVYFVLQFLTCVVLYVIIVVKIVTSERKMKDSRHMAKG